MEERGNRNTEELIAKIKELVKQGNIARILVKRNESTVLNIPLNVGIAGAVIGAAAAPWMLITAAVATLGLDCRIELIKKDGGVIELLSRDVGRKAAGIGSTILDNISGGKKE